MRVQDIPLPVTQPVITSAKPTARYRVNPRFEAALFESIVTPGPIQYSYIMALYYAGAAEPCFFVSAELNADAPADRRGSHALGLFDEDGHTRLSLSNAWGDRQQFIREALSLMSERSASTDAVLWYVGERSAAG